MCRAPLSIALTLYACVAAAQPNGVAECRSLPQDDARLACYDAAVDQLLVDSAPTATFGGREPTAVQPVIPAEPAIEAIAATITHVHADPRGKWVLELDNDQTWVQTDSRRLKLLPGDGVVIHKMRLGSYLLEKATGSRGIAVKRTD